MSGHRVLPTARIAAVIASALLAGGCMAGAAAPEPTPVAAGSEFSFADLLSSRPQTPTPSPSPSPTAEALSASSSSSSASRSSSAAAPAPRPPSGPANCPSGRVTGEITDFTVNEVESTSDGVPQWRVRVRGTALNNTARAVRDIAVTVTIHTDDAEKDSASAVVSKWVGTGASANWGVEFDEYESHDEPDDREATFAVTGWSWGEAALAQCPTPRWSS